MNGPRVTGTSFDLADVDEIDRADPDTYPRGEGWLHAQNGAATMKYDGDYEFLVGRSYVSGGVNLHIDLDGGSLGGEIELEPIEAFRLGCALISAAEAEYDK
jgi:hypothetical protein